MSSDWASIRSATVLKLQSVTGVENVLDYVIWTDDWDFILNTFTKDGRVNTWMVGLANNSNNEIDGDLKIHPYLINLFAYYSLKTDQQSSKTFEDLVLTVRDELMKSFNYVKPLIPAYDNSVITMPPNLIVFDNTVWLQQACHRAQIQLIATETVVEDLQCSG